MSAMQQRVQLAAVLVFFCPIKAELSHLSVEEFRNRGQGGGVRGAAANPGASSMIASTPAQMMLLSLKLEPGLEDHIKQQPCVNPYRSVPVYGWRWFQRFEGRVIPALSCWGISEIQAKMRDSSFELRRAQCVRRALSARGFTRPRQELSETHLNEILCHALTEAIRSKDPRIQFARRVELCMHEMHINTQLNITLNLEDIKLECMQKHKSTSMKPSIRNEELGDEFNFGHEMYINAVRKADALITEMNHCLRFFSLVGKEAEEYQSLEESCKNHSMVNSANHLDNEYQMDVCIFTNSTKGRVAHEDISIQYSCLNQLLSSPASSERSRAILLDLFWNQTQPVHMERQITCKALSGRPRWIKTGNGWELTCERRSILKAKRQTEIEDLPLPRHNSQLTNKGRVRGDFDASTAPFADTPIPLDTPVTSHTEKSPTLVATSRLQVMEELNQCILAKLRTSNSRAALKELDKAHRQWQLKHLICWNKFNNDEGQVFMKMRNQRYHSVPSLLPSLES
ncbi:uncharacterized protein LOC111261447 isoform X1 [Varroa jacobsoni]|uniref:uncharacterized protein LOC111261447 isoform X1 n=1 Tax=Varroa jacobsoni TaxID=62625 RepID=UPI000BF6B820|nr:uncharacterized protein LOC111261447 isoform X1 [Varroa jacobsoni]